MALVTIQRSPSPSVEVDQDQTDSSGDITDGKSQMRKRSKTSKEKLRTILSSMRFISKLRPCLSQSYFTVKGAALILPHTEFTRKSAQKGHGGEIQNHLQAMLHLLRPEDTIKIAVRLEDINQYQRYMALVSTMGHQDTEEAVILGIDCSNTEASIGLVLPIWMGLKIKLGGDGGFSMSTDEQCYLFKPVSVQAMWSAIQSFVKVQHIADEMKFIPDGLSHTWVGYYRSRVDRKDASRGGQWYVDGVEVFAPSSLAIKSHDADEKMKLAISQTLKEVMMTVDLDEATSIMLRKAVEEKMNVSLTEFKSYFDEEVMRILGQMDEPSEILEFLYLGSEWNASNLEELLDKGIDYILNVTKEIDNFFEGRFHYYNVRVIDEDKADLLRHWDKTYKFISKARSQKSKVLVHCKMGVSRSASTVMAFLMKDRRWSVDEAFNFVKGCRNCVHPNPGFMDQLQMYEAILTASNKRDIFRCKSDQNLLDEGIKDEAETSPSSFLGDNLFHMMSHSDWLSACGGVACGEEWIGSLHKDQGLEFDDLKMDTDQDTESCSVDSFQEDLPDLPSPTPVATRTAGHTVPDLEAPIVPGLEAPLTSHSSTGPAQEELSPDLDVAHYPETGLEVRSDRAMCLSENTECSQTSLAAQILRLKADSSWIRPDSLDTEQEENDRLGINKLLVNESVPSSKVSDNTDPSICGLDTAPCGMSMWQGNEQPSADNINQGPQFVCAAATVPESLPYLSTSHVDSSSISPLVHKTGTRAQFYIGNLQNSLNQSAVPSIAVDSFEVNSTLSGSLSPSSSERGSSNLATTSCVDQIMASDLQRVTGRPEPTDQPACQAASNVIHGVASEQSVDASLENPDIVIEEEGAHPSDGSYVQSEKILWKLGQEAMNQSGLPIDTEVEKDEVMQAEVIGMAFFQDPREESHLLDQVCQHQPTIAMSSSHSCMELCSQGDGDAGSMSLFERENIPLVPGTVLRTRLEIEERQRLVSKAGDLEMIGSSGTVLRTSSLKQPRDTPHSRYTQRRRLSGSIMSPFSGKSVDDLLSVGTIEVRPTDFGSSTRLSPAPMKDTEAWLGDSEDSKFATSVMLPQKLHLNQPDTTVVARPLSDQTSSKTAKTAVWDTNNKVPGPELSTWSQDVDKGKFDSHTLALIREIGSALSTSPTPPQREETDGHLLGTNMVKYFVRKIEKQTTNMRPTCKNVLANSNTWKSTTQETEESAKSSLADGDVHSGGMPSSSQCVALTQIKPRKASTQGTSAVFIELAAQPDGHQCFCSTAEIDNSSTNPGSDFSRTSLDVLTNDYSLESKHNIRPTILAVSKANVAAVGVKPACSPGQSAGYGSPELSVVKHLVGRFEVRSPDNERLSSESGFDYTHRLKDGHSGSLVAQPACEISQQDNNLHERFLEDSCSQISTSTSQAGDSLINNPLTPPLLASSLNPVTPSSVSAPLTSSQHVAFNNELTSTQAVQNPDPVKESPSIGINPPEPSEESARMENSLSAAASSYLEPQPLSCSSLEIFHKLNRPTDQVLQPVPCPDSSSSDVTQRRREDNHSDLAELEDVLMRQVSNVGRKIRRLHGKSHPLTKLSNRQLGRGPFYSSM